METITLDLAGTGEVTLALPVPGRFLFWWNVPGGLLATSGTLTASLEVGASDLVPLCSEVGGEPLALDLTVLQSGTFEFTGGGSSLLVQVGSDASNSESTVEVGITRLPN